MSSTDYCRRWARGAGTSLGVALLVVLSTALAWAPHAEAQTQCGALITLGPDIGQAPPGDVLTPDPPGDVVHITVSILQTCTTGGAPVGAQVTGTTRVDVACATANNLIVPSGTGCADLEQLNSLHVSGCVGEPGVSCAAALDGNGNPTIAEITYTDACPGGGSSCLALPFATPTLVATITATTQPGQQVFSPPSGEFAITASTGGSNVFSPDAQASAQGSAPEFYPAPTPTFTVDKACAATFNSQTQQVDVSFTATVANQDSFEAINYNCTDSTGALLTNNPGQAPVPPGTATLTGTYSQAGLSASDTITCVAVGATTGFSAGTQTAQATCSAVTNPSIDVPKVCTMAFNQGTQQFDVSFTATLTNTGDETIDNITCLDNPNVALTGVPATLAPGASAVVTGTYSTGSNPSSDTITCDGTGATSGTPVSSTQSATCQTTVTPDASLTKACVAVINAAGTGIDVSFTATLANTGPEVLGGITCADVPPTALTGVPPTLGVGGSATITGSYSTTGPSASDTVTCDLTGTVSGTLISRTGPATCGVTPNPSITVEKGSASGPNTCVITFNQANQNFDVTFSFTVTNNGTEALDNVTCSDNPAATLSAVPTTLAPGQSAVVTGSYSQAGSVANDTITCSGVGAISGTTVSANSPATCTTTVTPDASLTKACVAAINATGTGVDVSFTATLTNTGPEVLGGINCADVPAATLAGVPATLGLGASATITGSYSTTGPSASDTVTCGLTGTVSGTLISRTGPATCGVTPSPSITVEKGSANGPNTCLIDFNQGTQQFDVTFSFTVTNNGTEALDSVTCSDNPAATLSAVPTTLAPGQSAVVTGSYSQAGNVANDTITCNGVGAISGTTVSANSPATCTAVICDISIDKTCVVDTAFVCTKPITALTMQWNGTQDVRIQGTAGVTPFDIDNIKPGDVVTVMGYDGSQGNNVVWDIYDAGTNNFIGQSSFHLSCSDVDMNTADDCSKAEGDNKGNVTCVAGSLPTTTGNCVALWNLAGITGPAGSGASASLVCPGFGSSTAQTSCNVTLEPFVCKTPITALSMKWTGAVAIGIGGTAGANPGTPIDQDNIMPGDSITVSGYNNQGNDVFWNICSAGTSGANCFPGGPNFLGQSTFHLSCSDSDMNTADDCGKLEGNGKGSVSCQPGNNNASCIDLWEFDGMAAANGTLDCANPNGTAPVTYNYLVTNNTAVAVPSVDVTDTVTDSSGTTTVPICSQSLPASGTFTCSVVDQIGSDTTNIAHAAAPGCTTVDSNQVMVTVNGGGGGGACPTAQTTLAVKDREVKWKIKAPAGNSVEISKIEITFPQGANGVLQEVKRAGDTIFKGSLVSPGTITSFSGDAKKRTIQKGHTDELKFKFQDKPVAATGYIITVTFTNGCSVTITQ